MKQLQCVLVGAGNRGCSYSNYALTCPEELKILAVVDPDDLRRQQAQERYGIDANMAFSSLDAFLEQKLPCDFVINATMDELHYETAVPLIEAGYNLLLEKPVTAKKEELLDLQARAERKGVQVFVCHVLRYTPFFKAIKDIIDRGGIGTIISMEMDEHVWIAHFVDSYVRGKWRSEKDCGSGFLLAKSCHDTDLICWLNNKTKPVQVASFGSRSLFIPENAPAGATEYCCQCPHNDTCLYSAQKIHLEFDSLAFQTWAGMGKPIDTITYEEKAEYLKSNVYGKCAYNAGGDIVDRQSLIVSFENGSVANFTMVGGVSKPGRKIHICGTCGEIEGNLEEGTFIFRSFDRSPGKFTHVDTLIDINDQIVANDEYKGHAGGDHAIMHDLTHWLCGDTSSNSITSLSDSVSGHLVVYAAEESRKTGRAVACK